MSAAELSDEVTQGEVTGQVSRRRSAGLAFENPELVT
jgi:hypothetical protein